MRTERLCEQAREGAAFRGSARLRPPRQRVRDVESRAHADKHTCRYRNPPQCRRPLRLWSMATFTDVAALIPTLCGQLGDDGDAERAHASMMLMTDADVVSVLEETAALARQVEQIQVAAAGVIAVRSTRE